MHYGFDVVISTYAVKAGVRERPRHWCPINVSISVSISAAAFLQPASVRICSAPYYSNVYIL